MISSRQNAMIQELAVPGKMSATLPEGAELIRPFGSLSLLYHAKINNVDIGFEKEC